GLLGVDLRLAGVGLQPVAEGRRPGVVDDPDLGYDVITRPVTGGNERALTVEVGDFGASR
ncbi:hypothetical protein ACWDZ8_22145, partial [Streptomyces sp. NPDC003233]